MKTFLIRLASVVPRPLAYIVLGGLAGALFAPLAAHLLLREQVSSLPVAVLAALLGVVVASVWYVHGATNGGTNAVGPATTLGGNRIKKSTRLLLEVLATQAVMAVPMWFLLDLGGPPMPRTVKIVVFVAMNVALFVWFLQGRSADKESFTPRIWR